MFSGMNIHLPAILGFTRYQGFDTLPYDVISITLRLHAPQQFCSINAHEFFVQMWLDDATTAARPIHDCNGESIPNAKGRGKSAPAAVCKIYIEI